MFLLDWRLAVAALGLLPFFVWLTRRVGEERRRITAVRQDRLADISVAGRGVAVGLGHPARQDDGRAPASWPSGSSGESAELADLEVRSRMAGRWRMASVQISFAAMPALIYLFAGLTIANGGAAITIGTLVAFTTLQTRLFFPVQSLLSVGVDVQSSLALFERVFQYLDLPVEIEEREGAVTLAPSSSAGPWRSRTSDSATAPTARGRCATSTSRSRPARRSRSSARPARERRPSPTCWRASTRSRRAASRSTASTCATSATPRWPRSWASSRRRPTSSTPRSRTTCASRSRPRTQDELERAARAAQIHDLIERLPDGYETVVGERGYRFSGGEKQRIAIARTILRDPPILILDEATSALDTETERAVQAALDELARGRTTLAIAHRLSTVRDAEQIAVLEPGAVAELGNHDELIELGGRYAAMIEAQGGTVPTYS